MHDRSDGRPPNGGAPYASCVAEPTATRPRSQPRQHRAEAIALVFLDGGGRVEQWDAVATELTGFTDAEAVGSPLPGLDEYVSSAGDVGSLLDQATCVGHADGTGWQVRRDGTRFRARAVLTTRREGTGELRGYALVLHDLSAYRQAARAQRRARHAVVETQRIKSEFLANVSHELRTPLGAVLGYTEVLRDTPLMPEQVELLDRIRANATSMLGLILNLLDLGKMEARKLEVEVTPFQVRQLVRDALRAATARANQKSIELCCDIKPDVPDEVLGQPTRVMQVLANLLDNATKFTDAGEIVVTVASQAVNAGRDGLLRFSIADTGIGIPPDKHGLVFEPFVQIDGSMRRRYAGAGLGLTVARELVESMGGEMGIESASSTGTTVHFTLCVGVTRPTSYDAGMAVFADRTVLVADHNRTERRLLLETVARWGMRGIVAENTSTMLTALRSGSVNGTPIAIAVVDAEMPHRSGTRIVDHLERRRRAPVPVVLLMSPYSGADLLRYRRLGVAGYVSKPIVDSALRDVLGRVLRSSRRKRRGQASRSLTAPD
jgi:signal transduction histidine kinase/FixJ family two-component response regulator